MKKRQAGFTAVEGVIIAVIVLALVGVGTWVFQSQKDDTATMQTDQALEVPEVNTASDLESLEATMDEINLDQAESDDNELDAQSNAF